MKDSLDQLYQRTQELQSYYCFVDLRKRLANPSVSEIIYHEIELLKREKDLATLMQNNLALVMTSPDPNVRFVFESFKKGPITGMVVSKQTKWDDLYRHVDGMIHALERKLKVAKIRELECEELLKTI